jgi:hypothetical protein
MYSEYALVHSKYGSYSVLIQGIQRTVKTKLKSCAGNIECSRKECEFSCRPRTKAGQPGEELGDCWSCNSPLIKKGCDVKLRCDTLSYGNEELLIFNLDGVFKSVFRCQGEHGHKVPNVAKADADAKNVLKAIILNNPTKTPLELAVGNSSDSANLNSAVANINPSFLNTSRVGYLKRTFLQEAGIVPIEGESYLLEKLQGVYGADIIQSSSIKATERHISVAIKYMSSVLKRKSNAGKDIPGIQTDVTYSFFRNGFLLSSCVYDFRIPRWIPILFTWIEGNTTAHYVPHFEIVLQWISEIPDIGLEDFNLLAAQVMDFSTAQRNAFVTAYRKVSLSKGFFDSVDNAEKHAATLLKGCTEHYRASVQRLARNHRIVDFSETDDFTQRCMALLESMTPERFD